MVVAEALAGIALFNSAVAGIKQACGHAKSIGELGGLLDQLWTAEKQINQEANKRAGYSNFDGFKDVANEAINRRLMQESTQRGEVANNAPLRKIVLGRNRSRKGKA